MSSTIISNESQVTSLLQPSVTDPLDARGRSIARALGAIADCRTVIDFHLDRQLSTIIPALLTISHLRAALAHPPEIFSPVPPILRAIDLRSTTSEEFVSEAQRVLGVHTESIAGVSTHHTTVFRSVVTAVDGIRNVEAAVPTALTPIAAGSQAILSLLNDFETGFQAGAQFDALGFSTKLEALFVEFKARTANIGERLTESLEPKAEPQSPRISSADIHGRVELLTELGFASTTASELAQKMSDEEVLKLVGISQQKGWEDFFLKAFLADLPINEIVDPAKLSARVESAHLLRLNALRKQRDYSGITSIAQLRELLDSSPPPATTQDRKSTALNNLVRAIQQLDDAFDDKLAHLAAAVLLGGFRYSGRFYSETQPIPYVSILKNTHRVLEDAKRSSLGRNLEWILSKLKNAGLIAESSYSNDDFGLVVDPGRLGKPAAKTALEIVIQYYTPHSS